MIELKALSRYFKQGDAIIKPVDKIDFEFKNGSFNIIMGRSGSGKTTLLSLIAGILKPTSGKIIIDGTDIFKLEDKTLSFFRNRKIGMIFQFPSLFPSLNVDDNIRLPLYLHKTKDNKFKDAENLLKTVGLIEKKNSYPHELSMGQIRRVAIARALITNPSFILADEPTSDLDEATEEEVMELIKEFHTDGTTILMATHNSDLKKYGDQWFKLEKGKLS